ncbi:carbohydrate ABC transporter permease [Microbaculum marinisediminis]|uniref:Carbohydrate ABC transporter permease n=1 Tax=Microbaculum marinisediminis TaxID=2931392 RepID=A0AAW5R2P0_9HYPH|nr:carbohydrate ABC transporter permease [Microbaculum sp. A6E488]MCT8974238.1 carbohydrate ABC transporter permease [Microbaculum sp. A6E488]
MRRYDYGQMLRTGFSYLVLSTVTFVMCFPLIWALSTSLKPKDEIFATPPTLIPHTVTLENYEALVTGRPQYFQSGGQSVDTGATPAQFFTRWFANSVIVAFGATLISIVVSTLAAYSLTRFSYWGRNIVPYFSLLGYMVPSIIFVFPLFLILVRLELTDTLWSLILGYVCITLPFCMWLMWAFMRSIPIEIEEAALIDGASRLQVFRQVVLPTAMPGIIAAAIFSMIVSWNDYLFGRVFMNSLDNLTLTVGVMLFFEGTHVDWGLLMAASVLMTVPMAVLFMALQRHLVAGFGAGAVKG